MATIKAQAPDGKTLSIDVPQGTDPSNYDSIVSDAVGHYSSQQQPSISPQMAGVGGGYAADSGTNTQLPSFLSNINPVRALLTNDPTQNAGENFLRGLPASIGGIMGGAAGLGAAAIATPWTLGASVATGPADAMAGAGIGSAAGESLRQGAAQIYSGVTGSQFTPPGTAIKDIAVQGATGAFAEGAGRQIADIQAAFKPTAVNVGASILRAAAGVPEASGRAALNDLSLLGRAPSDAEVAARYDAFHQASGTIGRAQAVNATGTLDKVSRAVNDIETAMGKLRSGTLGTQEAVNASQAARIVEDQKRLGNELAQQVADQVGGYRDELNQFIQNGMGPRTQVQSIPVAQGLVRESTPIASKIIPQSEISQSATTLVTGTESVSTQEARDITPDLQNVIDMVKRARGNGLLPKSIMTDSERNLYDQFPQAIESSAEHNVPIQSLLTSEERSIPVDGSYQKSVLNPGEPIYAGKNSYKFGGTLDQVRYSPGEVVMGDRAVQVPAQPGYSEWQAARQAAWERSVADDFSSPFPVNQNGSTNQLRGYGSLGGAVAGAATSIGAGIATGHPVMGALGAAGSLVSPVLVSPMAYGTAIKYAAALSPIAKAAALGIRLSPGSLAAYYNSPGVDHP